MILQHEISVVVARQLIPGWTNYQISSDMLKPADAFTLSVRFAREAWELLALDQLVTVFVDRVPVVTGFIDERRKTSSSGGTTIEITGRDKTGRLVDESCPEFKYGGMYLTDLAEKIVGLTDDADPLFKKVTLVNTRNRSLLRDVRRPQAKAVREPVVNATTGTFRTVERDRPLRIDPGIFRGRAAPRRVQPGESRWRVLEEFVSEARLIAWSSADGEELFIGLPNYDQACQYWFHEAAGESRARAESNCEITVAESAAERYSMVTCVGAGGEDDYGENVTRRRATVYDNPENKIDGTGRTFGRRKALVMTDDSVRSARDVLERAEREQLEREATALDIEVTAPGHGQRWRGDEPTLFAIDTMARVEDEDTGTLGDFLVVSCEYSGGAGQPTQTRMRLVPRGTLLSL